MAYSRKHNILQVYPIIFQTINLSLTKRSEKIYYISVSFLISFLALNLFVLARNYFTSVYEIRIFEIIFIFLREK